MQVFPKRTGMLGQGLKPAVLSLVCAAAALALYGCGAASSQPCPNSPAKPAPLAPLAQRIGLIIPATATPIHTATSQGMDDSIEIALDMSDADWRMFWTAVQAKTPSPLRPFSAEQNHNLGPDSCGWTPGKTKGLETVQIAWRGGTEALNIGAAPTASGKRVFVFWHQL